MTVIVESSDNKPTLKALASISRIAEVIRKRPGHRFKISDFAAHAKLSESRFTALFRQIVGLPPYAYLADVRLKRAKELLAEGKLTVAKIARKLGYASPQHLAMQFRKTFGQTPTEWRRLNVRDLA